VPEPEGETVTAASDHVLARDLAAQAGRRLIDLRARGGDADVLRKAGDRLSHEFLAAELAARRPGDVVLSEEAADDPARLAAGRVWIVDPLDGTREFGEPGRTDWAVHVAVWERAAADGAGDLTAGAVALPAQDTVLSTAGNASHEQHGCDNDVVITTSLSQRRGWAPPPTAEGTAEAVASVAGASDEASVPGRVRIVVSRTRAPRFVHEVSARLGAELVPLGSAGAKVAAVICGQADAYLHSGGFYEWDSAAPVACARAAGLHASRIDGSRLVYNQADLLVPDILVCRPVLVAVLLQAIREVADAS
jgi:3'(2'), 5'-bisphosphate nucleotidase